MIKLTEDKSRHIVLNIVPRKKAGPEYGENCYVFSDFVLGVLLSKHNWKLVRKTKKLQFLCPPIEDRPPFQLKIRIPTKEYAITMAKELMSQGESVSDQLGEWPLIYRHKVNRNLIEYRRNIETGEIDKILHSEEPGNYLVIGSDLWSIEVSIIGNSTHSYENSKNISVESIQEQGIDSSIFEEGRLLVEVQNEYERNRKARTESLRFHGCYCHVCGFDFSKVYGAIGAGHIHVHHIVPVSKIGKTYIVDPIKDLIPVCSNCHCIIHSREPVYSIDELKEIIKRERQKEIS